MAGARWTKAKGPWVGKDEKADIVDILTGKEGYDIIPTTVVNQTVFNLSATPINPGSVRLFFANGVEQVNGVDFTVAGSTLTYSGVPALGAPGSETAIVKYFHA